jgi:hypothetical protein
MPSTVSPALGEDLHGKGPLKITVMGEPRINAEIAVGININDHYGQGDGNLPEFKLPEGVGKPGKASCLLPLQSHPQPVKPGIVENSAKTLIPGAPLSSNLWARVNSGPQV